MTTANDTSQSRLSRDLELHRQVLEDTVDKLQSSLHTWQQWYIEYASLQGEVTTVTPQPPSRKDLARIKRDYRSDIITQNEINEIFGKNDLRSAEQILSTLDRRLDYVERNVDTLQKQLEAAEHKLAASRVVAEPDGAVDEETGLPITDIIEEIDEEGNVVGHRLETAGDVSGKVLEALRKAGVEGFSDQDKKNDGEKPKGEGASTGPSQQSTPPAVSTETTTSHASKQKPKPKAKRKSVTFAEDTKEDPPDLEADAEEDSDAEAERLRAQKKRESIMEQAQKDQDEFKPDSAIVPDDEDEDDARLRREMLEYSQQEIGPIVAELELDEGATDDGDDDYDFDYTDEEDEEDELGRSKYSVITPDYVRRMQELEKRLGVESAFATERALPKNELNVEGMGRITVQTPSNRPPEVITEVTEITEAENKPKAKKGVRFAAELDIADEGKTTATLPERPTEKKPEDKPISEVLTERPISDVITERPSKPVSTPGVEPTRKPSRFKKDRATGTPVLPPTPLDAPARFLDQERKVAPSGPDGKTLADAVAERNVSTQPIEPDELDATLLHQEAAVEYHKMRNRLIQKQGGFAKEEEKAITPLDELEEEEGGGKKRMSRFKAARLQRQGL